jgi:hypothetical protein
MLGQPGGELLPRRAGRAPFDHRFLARRAAADATGMVLLPEAFAP